MGKKNKKKKVEQKPVLKAAAVETKRALDEIKVEEVKTEKVVKAVSTSKNEKPKKAKKEKKGSRLLKRLKETGSELKKVTWPTFPKVVKQTGVVLAVVIFFGIVLFGFDYLLKFLFELLVG